MMLEEDAMEGEYGIWAPPSFAFGVPPTAGPSTAAPPMKRPRTGRNFYRSAQWCMDASAVLTLGEDQVARVYSTEALRSTGQSTSPEPISLPMPSPTLSSAWFPSASASTPATYCFALSLRDAPVRLVDASTGETRATYPIVDHRERYVAPWSMAWNTASTKLYCGHENAIEVLDIASPGHGNSERFKTSRTKGDKGGQKGIVSALAFAKDHSGLYAAGTYGASGNSGMTTAGAGSVSLYDEDTSGAVGHLGGVDGGGVTQIAFHPLSPSHLFLSSRRSSSIQAYDTRNPSQPFHTFERNPSTTILPNDSLSNQRMTFDIDPWGRYMAAGNASGDVRVWSIGQDWADILWEGSVGKDAVSSVQFSSVAPELLVAVGSREGPQDSGSPSLSSTSGDSSSEEGGDSEDEETRRSPVLSSARDGYMRIISFAEEGAV